MNTTKRFISVLVLALAFYASLASAQSAPKPVQAHAKPLVFLSGTGATQTTASRGLFGTANSSTSQHDQTIEMAKDFAADCAGVMLTIKQDTANYTVLLNFERNNHSQLMIAGSDGAILFTDTRVANILTGTVGGTSVKAKVNKACDFITTNWSGKTEAPDTAVAPAPEETLIPAPKPVRQTTETPVVPAAQQTEITVPQSESLGDIARRYKKTNPNAQQGQ